MKLEKVKGPTFRFKCTSCIGVFDHLRSSTAYADLDGPPFKAYYCSMCAEFKLEHEPDAIDPNSIIGSIFQRRF